MAQAAKPYIRWESSVEQFNSLRYTRIYKKPEGIRRKKQTKIWVLKKGTKGKDEEEQMKNKEKKLKKLNKNKNINIKEKELQKKTKSKEE